MRPESERTGKTGNGILKIFWHGKYWFEFVKGVKMLMVCILRVSYHLSRDASHISELKCEWLYRPLA